MVWSELLNKHLFCKHAFFCSLSHFSFVAIPTFQWLRLKPLGHHQLMSFLSFPIYNPWANSVCSNFKINSGCERPPPKLVLWYKRSPSRTWISTICLSTVILLAQLVSFLARSQSDSLKIYHILPLSQIYLIVSLSFKVKAQVFNNANIFCLSSFSSFDFITFILMQQVTHTLSPFFRHKYASILGCCLKYSLVII